MEQGMPTNKDLAFLLFSGERAGGSTSDELQSAIQRTFNKLRMHLSTRLGSEGYYNLLKRAMMLAADDFPWLASVTVTEKGGLEGFGQVPEVQAISETADGCVAVLARVIELLETFIGRKLCRRVLHTVWPNTVQFKTDGS